MAIYCGYCWDTGCVGDCAYAPQAPETDTACEFRDEALQSAPETTTTGYFVVPKFVGGDDDEK